MPDFVVRAEVDGDVRERTVASRREAERAADELRDLDLDPEIIAPASDGGETIPAMPEGSPPLNEDPIEWVPEHFVDVIQGVPAINRKGYAVLAADQGISVTAEPIKLAHDTGFEHAVFRATAVASDGSEYSGFGSAHVERDDDAYLLNELAETRAMKRATAWATGVGMTAVEELRGDAEVVEADV